VLVTGATRGIGAAIAKEFYDQGAKVIGTGTKARDVNLFNEYIQVDFSSTGELYLLVERVKDIKPDILINNAGINVNAPFLEIDPKDFLLINQVNVFSPFMLCQASIPAMVERGWGRIINIASIWGKVSKKYRAPYSASKFALDGLTLALAAEYAGSGILANCVSPGFTDTELTSKTLGQSEIAEILKTVPVGRMASPVEIARFVVWLASPMNTYISGQNIAIDGGFSRV
jgi:3-oxoacyl-[acyl-carrier protein] reductase